MLHGPAIHEFSFQAMLHIPRSAKVGRRLRTLGGSSTFTAMFPSGASIDTVRTLRENRSIPLAQNRATLECCAVAMRRLRHSEVSQRVGTTHFPILLQC